MNGPNTAGVGAVPVNNMDGVRMSTAITHLNPMRHRLNLTVRGNVFVRRVLLENGQVVGVEAESGREVFHLESNAVVLSAGALKSPHILMLSGIGPRDQLEEFGIPVVHESPGVGQNLWNHPSVVRDLPGKRPGRSHFQRRGFALRAPGSPQRRPLIPTT